jgi:hypothetical protein
MQDIADPGGHFFLCIIVPAKHQSQRLRDAGLLGRVAKKKPYLRLANKNKRLRWAKEHRHWTKELCLEDQYPGVASPLLTLRLVFCRYNLMKLPVEDF